MKSEALMTKEKKEEQATPYQLLLHFSSTGAFERRLI